MRENAENLIALFLSHNQITVKMMQIRRRLFELPSRLIRVGIV